MGIIREREGNEGKEDGGAEWRLSLPSSMHVIPNDQTSTLPSYCPSSIARITSGAILGVQIKEANYLPRPCQLLLPTF